jgi:hypothetical protein
VQSIDLTRNPAKDFNKQCARYHIDTLHVPCQGFQFVFVTSDAEKVCISNEGCEASSQPSHKNSHYRFEFKLMEPGVLVSLTGITNPPSLCTLPVWF